MRMLLQPRKYRRLNNSPSPTRSSMSRARRKATAGEGENLPRIRRSLQDLPPEIIYHIATFLDTNSPDLRRLMQTCRLVSFAAEYHRYTSIIVSGQVGVRLMTTLILVGYKGLRTISLNCSLLSTQLQPLKFVLPLMSSNITVDTSGHFLYNANAQCPDIDGFHSLNYSSSDCQVRGLLTPDISWNSAQRYPPSSLLWNSS